MNSMTAGCCCQDSGTAKKLAFSREVSRRCITLEGDDFNPGGLLTGGSRSQGGSVLTKLHELMAAEQKLEEHSRKLAAVEQQLQAIMAAGKEYKR